jgi:hypothetical protein
MKKIDFIKLDSENGHLIYECLLKFNKNSSEMVESSRKVYRVSQFISDLLQSDRNDLVIWVHKPSYTFKIVNPVEAARLWGPLKKRKNKNSISYDNMERGIRFSKDQGYFIDAPELLKDRYTLSFGTKALEKYECLKNINNDN